MSLSFNHDFAPEPERPETIAPLVRRIVAANPGLYTFRGTNTYVLGEGSLAVIDPGPEDFAHVGAILAATKGERIERILLTHSHRDHCGAVELLREASRADIAPLRAGESLYLGECRLLAIATPGHASDHLCFALEGSDLLFTGDHVMGWSTSVIAPPDGAMADYLASLELLLARRERLYLPGHGAAIEEGPEFARGLIAHRKAREAAILVLLEKHDHSIPEIVSLLYAGIDPGLIRGAGLSVLAHLEHLIARQMLISEGPVSLTARYRLAI